MKKRLLGILLVLVALVALCVISVSAADVDFSAGGTVNGYCQHCKTNVDWLPLTEAVCTGWGTNYSEANGTHYYVADDEVKLAGGILTVAAGEELCLHLNGNTLYRSSIRAFNLSGTLNIMDHAANEGVLYAYAESSSTGGVVRLAAATGVLNLYGGTLQMKTGSHSNCVSGGVVYLIEDSTFNMYGGTLTGGKAKNGGNLFVGKNADFTMTGGTITGGEAINTDGTTSTGLGGNIYLNSGAVVNISDATITKGHADERGGNLVTTAVSITLNITDSVISGGSCDKHGGNMYLNNGYITITDTTVTGGNSKGSGGNIITYVGASKAENYLKLKGCTITDGTAGTWGGNVYVSGNSSGTGTLTLGNCTVTGGTCGNTGDNIFVANTGKLAITKDFAGEASVHFNSVHLSSPIRGGKLVSGASCEGPFTGKLYVENDAQLPQAYGKAGDTTIYVKAAAIVKNNSTKVWYDSNADAVAAYGNDTKYLVANAGQLALTGGDYTVDLGGVDVNVTGTGSVTFMDSANADFATYGTATVTGVTVKNTAATEVDGNTYYTVNSGNTYSFHRLGVELTSVNIRPSSSGIYYDGLWQCDDALKGLLESYGVAVSLVDMPRENFEAAGSSLFTAYGKDTLESGTTKTGVIIEGILAEKENPYRNDKNGRKPIYARAYVKLVDGTVVMSKYGAAESLNSAMTTLDQIIKTNNDASRKYLHDARQFYNTWKEDGMGDWELKTIAVQPKVEDGKFNLLMVGNSFCYYYVEELYELLAENLPEGITEVNIYNVYHSGCRVDTHYQKWVANAAHYTIFKTDAQGRRALTGEYTGTLEQALALEDDWDFISLQGNVAGGSYLNTDKLDDLCQGIATNAEPLLARFHDLHPNAQLLWHRTWFPEIGRVTDSGYAYTAEDVPVYEANMQYVCDWMCEEFDQDKPYDLIQVNSGASWTKVRAAEGVDELLPFGGLCARLGYSKYGDELAGYTGVTTNSGDGYHEGDIGGAQMLNAYSWYETLTGQDCRETVYRPAYTHSGTTYTLPEELVQIMQDAVHSTVPQMPETVQPAK